MKCFNIGGLFRLGAIAGFSLVLPFAAIIARAGESRAANGGPTVTLHDFKMVGELTGDNAAFTLTATARVDNSKGGTLDLLSGPVALTEVGPHRQWRVGAEQNRFA